MYGESLLGGDPHVTTPLGMRSETSSVGAPSTAGVLGAPEEEGHEGEEEDEGEGGSPHEGEVDTHLSQRLVGQSGHIYSISILILSPYLSLSLSLVILTLLWF